MKLSEVRSSSAAVIGSVFNKNCLHRDEEAWSFQNEIDMQYFHLITKTNVKPIHRRYIE